VFRRLPFRPDAHCEKRRKAPLRMCNQRLDVIQMLIEQVACVQNGRNNSIRRCGSSSTAQKRSFDLILSHRHHIFFTPPLLTWPKARPFSAPMVTPPKKKAKTARIAKNATPASPPAKADLKGKGKATAADAANGITTTLPSHPLTFKVVAGSYEKLLYGFEGSFVSDGSAAPELKLKPIFIFPAHVSCVKAVATSPQGGKWLATGSADEIIKVWDLRRRKEIGGLMHHEGPPAFVLSLPHCAS
jgi:WD40 repeat protein